MYIYIYTHIYIHKYIYTLLCMRLLICVCVCVCGSLSLSLSFFKVCVCVYIYMYIYIYRGRSSSSNNNNNNKHNNCLTCFFSQAAETGGSCPRAPAAEAEVTSVQRVSTEGLGKCPFLLSFLLRVSGVFCNSSCMMPGESCLDDSAPDDCRRDPWTAAARGTCSAAFRLKSMRAAPVQQQEYVPRHQRFPWTHWLAGCRTAVQELIIQVALSSLEVTDARDARSSRILGMWGKAKASPSTPFNQHTVFSSLCFTRESKDGNAGCFADLRRV